MREFLDNPKFTSKQDQPRENNRRILIDFFDSWTTFEEFEQMGKFDELLYIAGIGCHGKGTKILMHDETLKNVEDINVGEKLMGNDYSERTVKRLFRGTDKMYKVTPKKGKSFIVNSQHILSLKVKTELNRFRTNEKINDDGYDIISIKVADWLKLKNTVTKNLKIWRVKKDNTQEIVDIKSIDYIGVDNYYGFNLDGNNLYLLDDFTVTHNSGKSFYSSKATQYIIHRLLCLKDPQSFYNKARGTKIAFINISTSLAQAKDIVFGEIKNRIDNSPWFQENYPPDQKIKSVLRFPKSIYVLPVGSNEEAPLGYTIFGGIIDEASFHKMTKDKDYAEESYHQIKKRIASRFLKNGVRHGKMCIITSPRYVNDFAERKMREDNSDTVLKRRVPLWEAMPKETFCGEMFDIGKYLSEHKGKMCPIEYERDFIQNPERAMRDFGAQASLAIEAFFRDHTAIDNNVNKERRHPFNKATNTFEEWFYNRRSLPNYDPEKYYIHCDLGLNKDGKGDNAAIAMGRFAGWETYDGVDGKKEKRPLIKIAYMERISSGPKTEILFSEVRERIYQLKDIGYNIHKVFYDGWQSVDSVQTLRSAGFDAAFFSVDRNPEAYHTLKAALLEGRLDYYYYKPFIEELQQLEEVKGNKIDHPRLGKKDVSDCVASICYHSAKGSSGSGVLLH